MKHQGTLSLNIHKWIISRIFLIFMLLLITNEAAEADPYVLVMSKEKELCDSMLKLYNKDMDTYGRINYDSHEVFTQINWLSIDSLNDDSYSFVQRAIFDINNDGKNELVVKSTMQEFNYFNDVLYIFPMESNVLSKLKPGKGGLEALSSTPDFLFGNDTNYSYHLKNVPTLLKEQILAYKLKHLPKYLKKTNTEELRKNFDHASIGGFFVLQPFIWHGTTYISMADRNPEWLVVGKYKQAKEIQDICYFYDQSHKFINY
ncbi:hypothetical protein [Sulfuriferula nivalis]|uniref:Uncharacterized protein n=1 Tax=Sulfuriferula nivalis TaxID=2675298 RepID=A0A809SAT3_9PROT|nr:hypothetical protein [Sulfuriferula nivalis]BBP01842.1 hypothetical protein SFSGTM_25500 [Sulfuriferula nivalis]